MNTVNFISIPGSIVPDQEVLVFGQNRLTYAELNDLVSRIASVFKKLGLKRGLLCSRYAEVALPRGKLGHVPWTYWS